MLTRPDVAKAVARLVAAFGPPFGNDPEAVTREWHRALERRGTPDDLDRAVSDVVAEATKWPTVAQLRAALDSRVRGRTHTGMSPAAPAAWPVCVMCRAEYYYAGYELPDGRVVARLRCRCAKSAPSEGWRTPAARAWRELDARLQERDWRATMHDMVTRTIPGEDDLEVVAAREAKRTALLRSLGEHEAAA